MYQRFINTISNPKLVFLYVKDSFLRIVSYIILMSLIISIPVILIGITNKSMLFPSQSTIRTNIESNFYNPNIRVVDGILVNDLDTNLEISNSFSVDNFTYVIGDIPNSTQIFLVAFEKEGISLYTNVSTMSRVLLSTTKYTQDFEFSHEYNYLISNMLVNVVNDNPLILSTIISAHILGNIFDYIFLALILSLMAMLFKSLPLPFKAHFKVSIYIMSTWAIVTLILSLFNLTSLSFIAIIIAYVYQTIAYGSIRLVRNVGVKDKDEE